MDFKDFHIVEDMNEVTHVFKKIFDDKKTFGTDVVKMGFFMDKCLTAKVHGNKITFVFPFNDGSPSKIKDILEHTHYNKTNSIMVVCEISDDNTEVVATFYSKEYKLFMDF